MTMNKNAFLYSPLLGGIIASIAIWIYSIFLISNELSNSASGFSISGLIVNAGFIFLIIVFLTLIISYLIFYPCLFLVEIFKKKYLLSEEKGWAIMFLIGLIIGLSIAIPNYFYQHSLIKSILIIFCFSFGLMFNMSFFSTLNGNVKNRFIKK